MSILLKSLGIDALGIEERLALIEALWDSIAAQGTEASMTQVQRAELERRIAAREVNPYEVVTWVEVKAAIYQKSKE